MQRCQTVTVSVPLMLTECFTLVFFHYFSLLSLHSLYFFFLHLSQFLLSSSGSALPWTLFHTHGVVFPHCSLCSSPFPTLRPVIALTGSGAGWDDSRARFSLWVYYLCSGPFKTTQNGPGSQCGEFVLTSCLSLFLLLTPPLGLFLPPVSTLLGIGRELWSKKGQLVPCFVSCFLWI